MKSSHPFIDLVMFLILTLIVVMAGVFLDTHQYGASLISSLFAINLIMRTKNEYE